MKQQLSALMDGELDMSNAEHLILAAKSNGDVAQAWSSYHLIGDVIRGEAWQSASTVSRIMDAIEDEPTVLVPRNAEAAQTTKAVYNAPMYWSIAASVAAVMFVGLMLLQHQSNDSASPLAPVQIAESLPTEYLEAHHAHAPHSATYYIQNVSYAEQR